MIGSIIVLATEDYDENRQHALKHRSAWFWADKLPDVPLLALHGGGDDRVPVEQSRLMAKKLESLNRTVELVIYEGGDHTLSTHRPQMLEKIQAFLEQCNERSASR